MSDRHPEQEGPPPIPRWVTLLAIGGALVVALVIVAIVLTGGTHGPGMHMP